MLVGVEPFVTFLPERLDEGRVNLLRIIDVTSLLSGEVLDGPEGIGFDADLSEQLQGFEEILLPAHDA